MTAQRHTFDHARLEIVSRADCLGLLPLGPMTWTPSATRRPIAEFQSTKEQQS
jgi:hypothetical protein